jgi:transcriptional regulator with AAA-type ATPase domain/tetratricopeptide (TPR) repeat protein
MVAVHEFLRRVVGVQAASRRFPPILIRGETGSGKGLVARTIHSACARARGPFVDVDCAAIPETLLEAELFGHERGAFTDAREAKAGLFQAADGGTLFLDEIGSLPKGLQVKLLKAVEERTVRRLGSVRSEAVDVRIIAATNEDLVVSIKEGQFREDLYHRLSGLTLVLPPLRERGQDISLLADHFLSRACAEYGVVPKILSTEARGALLAYRWPGNVRELANVMERVALLSTEPVITARSLGLPDVPGDQPRPVSPDHVPVKFRESVSSFERTQLLDALRDARGNISLAADRLGLPRTTLRRRIDKLRLSPGPESSPRPRRATTSPAPPARAATGQLPPPAVVDWERRYVAFLRADLGLRPGAVQPPEMGRALEVCIQKVEGFGGRLEQHRPGGIVAAFGLEPLEDAPVRAVLAAMAIRKAIGETRQGEWRRSVAAVHVSAARVRQEEDGIVLDEDDLRAAEATLDELVAIAEPNAIVVSAAAAPTVARRFDLENTAPGHGAAVVKGERAPGPRVLTPFIGREAELEKLLASLDRASHGLGQVVSVVGEAGLGKSRLLLEFKARLRRDSVECFEGSCFAYGDSISYLPFLRIVKDFFGLEGIASEVDAKRQIEQRLATLELDPAAVVPYLHHLLSYTVQDEMFPKLPPHVVRERTVNALKTLILAVAARQPLVLILEDAHWIDKAAEEVAGALVEALAPVPLLLLLVYRPEYLHAWATKAYHTHIPLSRLPGASSAEMVRAILQKPYASTVPLPRLTPEQSTTLVQGLLGASTIPPELEQLIATRTDGNPFFLEELSLALLESGDLLRKNGGYVLTRPADTLRLPTTVQGVLLARVDRLTDGLKSVLQMASVIGRVFSYPVLARAVERCHDLDQALLQLEDLEFIYSTSLAPQREYSFKHVLTQQAVYDALLRPKRNVHHERVGQAIEALYSDRLEEHYELLAYHYVRSANADRAVEYLDRANGKAARANAMVEAKTYFDEAMKLLDGLPDTEANRRRRIALLVKQWLVFWLLFIYTEYYQLLERYEDMVVALGEPAALGAFYTRLGHCQWVLGELELSLRTTERAVEFCEAAHSFQDGGMAYCMLQWIHLYLGNYDEVLRWEGPALRALDKQFDLRWYAWAYGASSWAHACVGRWDSSVAAGRKELELAERYSDKSLVCFANWNISLAYTYKGDLALALEHGELAVREAPTPADRIWAQAHLALAWCRAGESRKASELLASLVPLYQRTRFVPGEVIVATYLGEAYWRAGERAKAVETLETVLDTAGGTGMRFYGGVAHSLLGEIASSADSRRAATHFEQAIEILEGIGAENELALACAAHARLMAQQGRVADARARLSRALEIFERLGTLIEPDRVRGELAELGV